MPQEFHYTNAIVMDTGLTYIDILVPITLALSQTTTELEEKLFVAKTQRCCLQLPTLTKYL